MDNKFTLEIDSSNAAFDPYAVDELKRILREVADTIEVGSDGGNIRDVNGNTVGYWEFVDSQEGA